MEDDRTVNPFRMSFQTLDFLLTLNNYFFFFSNLFTSQTV